MRASNRPPSPKVLRCWQILLFVSDLFFVALGAGFFFTGFNSFIDQSTPLFIVGAVCIITSALGFFAIFSNARSTRARTLAFSYFFLCLLNFAGALTMMVMLGLARSNCADTTKILHGFACSAHFSFFFLLITLWLVSSVLGSTFSFAYRSLLIRVAHHADVTAEDEDFLQNQNLAFNPEDDDDVF